jgi:hypothetical protein
VYHEEDEGDPRHVGASTEIVGDAICATGGDENGSQATPQVEETNQIEDTDALNE